MRVRVTLFSLALFALLSAGCMSPICGTWCGSGAPTADNPIAGVTFCHDGTFTANADYGGGKTHAISGCYRLTGDKLCLCMKDEMREYGAKITGNCLDLTHKDKTQRLCRVKGCASCSKCCFDGGGAACCKK